MNIQGFDSLDDAWEAMRKGEEQALTSLTETQIHLPPDSYWVSFRVDYGILIFGDSFSTEEIIRRERELGASEEELAGTIKRHVDALHRGYLYGKCYSVVEPNGELGSTHRFHIHGQLTEEQFEQAKDLGWDPKQLFALDWFQEIYEQARRDAEEILERIEDEDTP